MSLQCVLVISHDLAVVPGVVEGAALYEERHVLGLEGGEHARDLNKECREEGEEEN